MNARRGGLGRGLGALIPTGPDPAGPAPYGTPPSSDDDQAYPGERPTGGEAPGGERSFADGTYLTQLAPDAIRPNPRQPRTEFDEDALRELETSLREVGMLQPVVVRPVPGDDEAFELVMGERRWRAAQLAGLPTIPAIVRRTDDDAMLRDALLENLHRAQLNPLEEAAAYQQLLQEFGATHEELAGRIGRSRSQVSNTIRLLNLPGPVQRRVAAGVLSAGHARALLAVEDAGRQEALATRIVAEGLSVRSVEEIVATEAGPSRPRRSRSVAPADEEVIARGNVLGGRVADRLDTRVKVELGRARGRLVIEVADVDDLARIVQLIAGPSVG